MQAQQVLSLLRGQKQDSRKQKVKGKGQWKARGEVEDKSETSSSNGKISWNEKRVISKYQQNQ